MRRSVLLAVPLLFVSIPSFGAQQAQPASASSSDTIYVATPKPELTPRQAAELKGDVFMARKEFGEAAGAYEALLETEPKNAQLLNKTAIAYQELGSLNRSELMRLTSASGASLAGAGAAAMALVQPFHESGPQGAGGSVSRAVPRIAASG